MSMIHIVGAGPAGLIASLFLLEKGYEVEIFEKNKEIKSSACGEGCDLKSLAELPFDSLPYIERKVNEVRWFFRDKTFYVKTEGCVLNRQKWMEAMAKEIMERGGKINFGKKVVGIDNNYIYFDDGKIKYDICIGADGPASVIKDYVGNEYDCKIGCQYEIKHHMKENRLEFYLDKKFSSYYIWIFPKKESINVGLIGKFSMLDEFLKWKGIEGEILKKQAGSIPCSLPKKLVKNNVALVGDAASITNPFSLGGLTPIIYASKILADNIENLSKYEKEIKKHPMCNPIFLKGMKAAESITNEEMEIIFNRINGKNIMKVKWRDVMPLLRKPSLFIKMYHLGKAMLNSMKWGW